MPHSYANCLFHVVFSTKNREPLIPVAMLERLWGYVGGIAERNSFRVLGAGGVVDHLHVLVALPATLPVAKAVQLLKAGSAKWLNQEMKRRQSAIWQQGYSAFSIGVSQVPRTLAYIAGQREHHRTVTFQEEYLAFLKKHGIAFDPKYGWG